MKYFFIIIIFLSAFNSFAQIQDTLAKVDTTYVLKNNYNLNDILNESNNLNFKTTPLSYEIRERIYKEDDFNFYIIIGIVLFFGLIRAIFPKYSSNIFRVFFNASLRQGQLTDQLVQAKFPSLLYNIFFAFSFSIYIYYLFRYLNIIYNTDNFKQLLFIFIAIVLIYLFKWLIIKFIGWITNYEKVAENYLFVVFLLNKVLGIYLLPVTIIIAFSNSLFVEIGTIISYVLVVIFLGLRYLKMYESLSSRIKLNGLHFFIFLFAVEILPLMLISKTSIYLFAK
ncbi:MAG: DUF4271 domain-containing protein [Ferruginibacter sp.]